MNSLSISKHLSTLPLSQAKQYLTQYPEHGYECGIGRQGTYPGHSHLHFHDIMFSPAGISIAGCPQQQPASLVVVPKRTFLPQVEIGDFFFIKFCTTDVTVPIPDKTETQLHDDSVKLFRQAVLLEYRWYKRKGHGQQSLKFRFSLKQLTVECDEWAFSVRK